MLGPGARGFETLYRASTLYPLLNSAASTRAAATNDYLNEIASLRQLNVHLSFPSVNHKAFEKAFWQLSSQLFTSEVGRLVITSPVVALT